jgi:hypothetical protein
MKVFLSFFLHGKNIAGITKIAISIHHILTFSLFLVTQYLYHLATISNKFMNSMQVVHVVTVYIIMSLEFIVLFYISLSHYIEIFLRTNSLFYSMVHFLPWTA